MNIDQVRKEFPITESGRVYLDHAAKTPLSRVGEAAFAKYYQQRAIADPLFIQGVTEARPAFRSLMAKMLNADMSRVGVAHSTSWALNLLVNNLRWAEGDEVIVYRHDFPTNVFPFLKLQELYGVNVKVVQGKDGIFAEQEYLDLITDRTKLLTVSAVNFLSGQSVNLKMLGDACRAHDVLFCVDAIQGLGAVPIDLAATPVDFLASGGHKWLMIPQGVGCFYYSQKLESLWRDVDAGWLDRENIFDLFTWDRPKHSDAERFFLGCGNDLGVALANGVLNWRQSIGEADIYSRVMDLTRYTRERLQQEGLRLLTLPDFQSGITTFFCQNATEVQEKLLAQGIHISQREGMIRISPHFYNTKAEIDLCIRAMLPLLN